MLERLKWLIDRRTTPPGVLRARYALEYAAIRLFAFGISLFPIEWNLMTGRMLGRIWWRLFKQHRERSLEHLRLAFGTQYSDDELRRIARASLEHFAQLYAIEMTQTPRLINEWSWPRYVELGDIGPALREMLRDQPTIMLTAHFGNFELMGHTIAKLGLPISAVMRPLDNPRLNKFLMEARHKGGLTLLYKSGATEKAREVLESRGTLCFIADQNAGRKGYFVDFFGQKASTYKSIALLAMQYRAPIICGSAVRTRRGFHYRIDLDRIIRPEEWENRDDAALWITQEFSTAMETAIRRHPEQYLWVHRRWKTRPPGEVERPTPRETTSDALEEANADAAGSHG